MTAMFALAMWTGPAHASTEIGDARPFGLGIQLGTFSGLTGKYYLGGRKSALTFGVGAGYGDAFYNSFHVHLTYSQHFGPLASGDGVTIPWRVGIGGWINSGNYWVYRQFRGDGLIIGARAPIGLDFDLEEAPVQFYIEVALDLAVFPGVLAGLDAGIGGRFYF